jgi:RNA polymerase sigma-70 factor (ECF subfamily)
MLSELSEVLEDSVAEQTEEGAIGTVIDAFLRELPKIDRVVFVRRYFYGCSIAEIVRELGMSVSKIKSMLHRTRKKLRVRLQKEGIII